jgi:hypothetical protein
MSSIAHKPRQVRARLHSRAVRSLVGAILVASTSIVLALAFGDSDADRTAPAAGLGQAAPAQIHQGAPSEPTQGPTPCCGHRP